MKTFFDRLKEMPVERLKSMIDMQKNDIAIMQRDLERMERALQERSIVATVQKSREKVSETP